MELSVFTLYTRTMSKDEYYESKPSISIGKVVVAGLVAVVGIRVIDPPLFNSLMQGLTGGFKGLGGGSGNLTCADVDKQYHVVSPQEAGGYKFNGPQTASCIEIQRALEAHHSPMAPYEPQIYKAYADAGINNGAAMGVAWQEGAYGTVNGVQRNDENIGAMRYANPDNYPNPNFSNDNGWMDFHAADSNGEATGWVASAQDHAALINHWIHYNGNWNGTYKHGGDGSVKTIISILSPSSENNVPAYVKSVDNTMDTLYKESVDYQHQHPHYPAASTGVDVASLLPNGVTRRG